MVDENDFANIAYDINAGDKYGRTVLHYAVDSDRLEVAKLLIKYGANVNARANGGVTPHKDEIEAILWEIQKEKQKRLLKRKEVENERI